MLTAEQQSLANALPPRVCPGPILCRPVDPAIEAAAHEAAESDLTFGARGIGTQAFATFCQRLDDLVDSDVLREQLRADAQHLRHEWLVLTGNTEIRFSVCTIRDAHCPKVHVDHLDLRILCTYSGPGTLIEQNGELQQARVGDFVYLRGTKWGDGGVPHRSPPLNGETRLVLRVDGLF